jgi:hypothetical protein
MVKLEDLCRQILCAHNDSRLQERHPKWRVHHVSGTTPLHMNTLASKYDKNYYKEIEDDDMIAESSIKVQSETTRRDYIGNLKTYNGLLT